MFLDQGDRLYPVQPFQIANYVRAHRPSAPSLHIDALHYPRRHWRMPVGDSPLLSSYYACKSFTVQHGDTKMLNVTPFSIAIWDRNVIVSSIALSMWLVALGVSIRSMFRTPTLQTTPYVFPIVCMQL